MIKVVCAIIEKGNQFLACRRSLKKSQAGLWEFPGGKIHDNETPQQALSREIKEELGIELIINEKIGNSVHTYDHGSIDLVAFKCVIKSGKPNPTEHEEIRWVTDLEAQSLTWAPADIPLLNLYVHTI
jgi:8-oxo-dGTP diphosphatase